ncbi:MAG: hypothetical protein APF80_17285 [Alphaproteobacteria bacterium BRH_c36]|nr:MAG: hypothetical protein APF80_17285 [Alphaproteobacteria bacterium BRH_c36]
MQDKTMWIMLAAVIIICTTAWLLWPAQADFESVAVKLPAQLSKEAMDGGRLFADNCQRCHGENASGTSKGPPLIHVIYVPSHHSDASFYRAAAQGVNQHHWPYGNMPAIADVSREQVSKIIHYVRELQRANGIE